MTKGKSLCNKYGTFLHSEMIGLAYGSKMHSSDKKRSGFMFLLFPTPELWTRVLPHRTQILYHADISFISMKLEILPGSKVVECGTGSASFSHSISRSIGTLGHLYTFEFHKERAEKAQAEFKLHSLSNITIAHRDVCENGFGLVDEADAVFLDLPAPWKAVKHAKVSLRKDEKTKICCFSPCIEQIQKTIPELKECGFIEIELCEVLIRNHDCQELKIKSFPPNGQSKLLLSSKIVGQVKGHTSYLLFASLPPQ